MTDDELPAGWSEEQYEESEQDIDAAWVNEEGTIRITCHREEDEERGESIYPVIVEQTVEADGYRTDIQSHTHVGMSVDEAVELALQFMADVNAGQHRFRAIGAEKWREYVQFYCLNDSELPGTMTADDLIGAIDEESFEDDTQGLDDAISESDREEMVTVDIYPRHEREVEVIDDDE